MNDFKESVQVSEEEILKNKILELLDRAEKVEELKRKIKLISEILFKTDIFNFQDKDYTATIEEYNNKYKNGIDIPREMYGILKEDIISVDAESPEINRLKNIIANIGIEGVMQRNLVPADIDAKLINLRDRYKKAISIYEQLKEMLRQRLDFSKLVETAIIKMANEEGKNISSQEKFALKMSAYFSEYLPEGEKSKVLAGNYSEASLLTKMEEAGTPLILDNGMGIPKINDQLYNHWCDTYDLRVEEAQREGYNKRLSGINSLEMIVLVRNAIAHGAFVYNQQKGTIKLRGRSENGIAELKMSEDCILDLCKNYLYSNQISNTIQMLDDNSESINNTNITELFRYYINSIFSYNQYLFLNPQSSMYTEEPLHSEIINLTNGLGIDIEDLNHLRNSAAHRRIEEMDETIIIIDKDENGNESFRREINKADIQQLLSSEQLSIVDCIYRNLANEGILLEEYSNKTMDK